MNATTADPTTPLIELLRRMTPEQRDEFAAIAGTPVSYMYQIGGGHRPRVSAKLAFNIEDASIEMNKRSGGFFPVVTARQVALMNDLSGLEGEDE